MTEKEKITVMGVDAEAQSICRRDLDEAHDALRKAHREYLTEAQPIIFEMAKLKEIFCHPIFKIRRDDDDPNAVYLVEVEEQWCSLEASTLYDNYTKLLNILWKKHFGSYPEQEGGRQ